MRAESESEQSTSFSRGSYCLWWRLRRTSSVRELLFWSNSDPICNCVRKNGLQQHHVKICKYGICMEMWKIFSIPYIKFSIPFHTWVIPYSVPIFSFHSIFHSLPFPAIVCPDSHCRIRHTFNNCRYRFCLLLQSNCDGTGPFFSTHFVGWLVMSSSVKCWEHMHE